MNKPTPTPPPAQNTQITPVVAPSMQTHGGGVMDKFCLALQEHEGYFKNAQYPDGTPAYKYNNPGNLFCTNDMNVLATGRAPSGECIFPDYATGYEALKRKIKYDISGQSKVYGPHCANMTIYAYLCIYSPRPENDPRAYADHVGKLMGVNPDNFLMKQLLS